MKELKNKGVTIFLAAGTVIIMLFFPAGVLHADQPLDNRYIIELINRVRHENGLLPLLDALKLKESSQMKVDDMVERRYFSHLSPEGGPFTLSIWESRYRYRKVGEVLAKVGKKNENRVLKAWLHSETHRRALLDPIYRDIGCSNRLASDYNFYVVCHLGRASK
ncbi:MAG: CAP domain-containing protein [Syntrophobacterales bacterium]|jgi:uncharacterized protein YkwD|nr:CAP domain-containing protein [Syntrophobacterales bacterium]